MKVGIPLLNWSSGALAALTGKGQREEMTRLFEAYFRVAGLDRLTSGALPLDLPGQKDSRHYFRATFTRDQGWVVEAKLKHEYRAVIVQMKI